LGLADLHLGPDPADLAANDIFGLTGFFHCVPNSALDVMRWRFFYVCRIRHICWRVAAPLWSPGPQPRDP
jgi:hypothetical protein